LKAVIVPGSKDGATSTRSPPTDNGVIRIAEIAHAAGIKRGNAGHAIDPAQQARLITHRARTVAGAGSVGDAAIERHADDGDISVRQILGVGRPEEGRNANVALAGLGIGQILAALGLLQAIHKGPPIVVKPAHSPRDI
jgi:hypothetical protein